MDRGTERIRKLSEDMLGLIDVAEDTVQAMYAKVCRAIEVRDDEIKRLRERVADLERQLKAHHPSQLSPASQKSFQLHPLSKPVGINRPASQDPNYIEAN